jgi:hypothetical protein
MRAAQVIRSRTEATGASEEEIAQASGDEFRRVDDETLEKPSLEVHDGGRVQAIRPAPERLARRAVATPRGARILASARQCGGRRPTTGRRVLRHKVFYLCSDASINVDITALSCLDDIVQPRGDLIHMLDL